MNVFAHVEQRIRAALQALEAEGKLPAELSFAGIDTQEPRDPAHGDMASNAAMVLAKVAKMKPRDIAEQLARKLSEEPGVAKAEVAGPGFLNLTFRPAFWHDLVRTILEQGPAYGRSNLGK